ncbi:Solute carrier family 22 member 15 [Strongyloides ratti]|uniref:Solute carrier family 22 member 15 n=1 Tax=Strongyloides ratti TaxID=34506 RepID=A0A090KXZ4_STRRB|nr:Solute carrier family 22 member 15 [Strongyloides ratti]CEF60707.1 Solute carrier family 22 member 15 [Strongyloides ratti]
MNIKKENDKEDNENVEVFDEILDKSFIESYDPSIIVENQVTTETNYGDFQHLGCYIICVLIIYEFLLLLLMGNITFLIFGAAVPNVIGCIGENKNYTFTENGCIKLYEIQKNESCIPIIENQFESIQSEYNLYCKEAENVKQTSAFLQMFAMMIGATFGGQLSDNFGRVKTIKYSLFFIIICCFLSSYATTIEVFNIYRFLGSIFVGTKSSVLHVLLLEYLPKQHRVWVSTIFSFSPNYIIFSFMAYYTKNWRDLMFVISFIGLIGLILINFVKEPVRWLIQKGKLSKARQSMIFIEKWSGKLTDNMEKKIFDYIEEESFKQEESQRRKKSYTFKHLFVTWKLTSYSLFFGYSALVGCFINYALIFNLEKVSGSIFMNTAYLGLIRWFFNISVGILDYYVKWFGRKTCHTLAMVTIILTLSIVLLNIYFPLQQQYIVRFATLFAISMCSQIFIANSVAQTELFPTSIRNIAVSFQAVFARLGSIVAPFLFGFQSYSLTLPYLIMVTMSIVDLTTIWILIPETKGDKLKDHLPNKDEWIFGKKNRELKLLKKVELEKKYGSRCN